MEKEKVLEIIREFDKRCTDEYISMNRITIQSDVQREVFIISPNLIEKMKEVEFTNYARSQILHRLGIPIRYFDKCPEHLKMYNFNYWSGLDNNEYLLRYYDNKVRGFLSNKFSRTKDDKDIIPIILDNLTEDMEVASFNKYLHMSLLRMKFNSIKAQLPDGSPIHVSICVTNSEVGMSAVTFIPEVSIYDRLGFISMNPNDTVRFIHRGDLKRDKIAEAITKISDIVEIAAAKLVLTGNEPVKNPILTTKNIFEAYDIPEELMKMTEEEINHSNKRLNKIELASIIMRCIEGLPKIYNDVKQRLSAQEAVGDLLGIFKNRDDIINQLVTIVE